MDKAFIAQGVANKVWATENAMDSAIAEASKLMSGIIEARQDLNCSHIVMDPAMKKVAESIARMAEARHALIEAHNELSEAKLRLGIRTKLIGVLPKVESDLSHVAELDRKAG